MTDAVDANVANDQLNALCEKAMTDTVSSNVADAELKSPL